MIPGPRATFSNRAFSDAPDDRGFPIRKSMRRIAGTGTFTSVPKHRHVRKAAPVVVAVGGKK